MGKERRTLKSLGRREHPFRCEAARASPYQRARWTLGVTRCERLGRL